MLRLSVSTNIDAVLAKFRVFREKYSEHRILLDDLGKFLVQSIKTGFAVGRSPKGQDWKELDFAYYPYRPGRDGVVRPPDNPVDGSEDPLINHGDMMKGLTHYVRSSEVIVGYGNNESADKGLIHQFGKPNNMRIDYGDGEFTVEVTPEVRKQIGFARWNRGGEGTDKAIIIAKVKEFIKLTVRASFQK